MSELTFIVPIYNVEKYVFKCLESIQRQTYKDFKVLCVNDGSTDNSRNIILDFVNKDSRFKLLDKENGGLSDARNYGLKQVDTKYVSFIDGDDFIEECFVEKTINEMRNNDLDILVFGYNQYYLEKNIKEANPLRIHKGVYSLKENKEILAYTPNAAWNKIYKTCLFKDNNIEYPFGYRHQDLGTTAKLFLKAKKIGYINDCLYNYLIDRPNNITTQIDKKLYHIIDMANEIIDYYKKNNVFEKYKEELKYLVTRNFISSLRKAVTLKDKEFVYEFIDSIFENLKSFNGVKDTYRIKEVYNDFIYTNKELLKTYYKLKHIGE